MGCGESKNAVATANTISQTKRSNSKKTNGSENETGIENVTNDVKTNTNTSLEEQEKAADLIAVSENANGKEGENVNKDSQGVNGKESAHQENGESVVETVKDNEVKEAAVVADGAKEANHEKDLKVESTKETSKKEEGGPGPDSPNHIFSPKKDEETIESNISEGLSGAKIGPSEDKTDVNEVVEQKGSNTDTKIEEAINENEGNQIKEVEEAVETTETGEVINNGEEKVPVAKEENVTESSAKDTQAN